MQIKIEAQVWANIFNVHYSACLSVIFALTVIAVSPNQPGLVALSTSLDPKAITSFLIMLTYLFVDCMVTNSRRSPLQRNVFHCIVSLFWIWFLGLCIIVSKSPDNYKYFLLPVYFFLARFVQFLEYAFGSLATNNTIDERGRFYLLALTIASLLVSILMLPSGFGIAAGGVTTNVPMAPNLPSISVTLEVLFILMSGIMLGTKIVELLLLNRSQLA